MDTLFSSINYSDPLWIAVALTFGLLGRSAGLPPLVGFLVAGFALNYFGAQGGSFLNEMADIGVTLLLFTIGLKLRVKELLRAEVWGVTLIHTLVVSLVLTGGILLLKTLGIPLFNALSITSALIIGFALSFSSTVFVVKVLESRGDFRSRYGQIAIGVLIVQDIIAVIFLGFSEAKLPSLWAILLLTLIFVCRPLLLKLLEHIGHGELQVLYGLALALGGATLFEYVDMKADLGALVFGVLLASHPKAEELAKTLFSLKELFLVGFFLSIGMAGLPTLEILLAVAFLLVALTFKTGLFFFLFSKFKVRTRSATMASTVLANYSEFGLIVSAVAVSQGWITQEWLVVMACLVSFSFVISSAINSRADDIYTRFQPYLSKFQHIARLADDQDINLTGVNILVCGMGRVGCGAFDHLLECNDKNILGLDFDEPVVAYQCSQGRNTQLGDFSSPDFWGRFELSKTQLEWVLLCSPNLHSNVDAAKLARQHGFKGFLTASAKYPDDEDLLKEAGVDGVFNIYAEAGAGLAQHGQEILNERQPPLNTSS